MLFRKKDEYEQSRELEEQLQKLHDQEKAELAQYERHQSIAKLREQVEKKKQAIEKMRTERDPGFFGAIKKSQYVQNFRKNSAKLAEKCQQINKSLNSDHKGVDEWKKKQDRLNKIMLGGK